MAPDDRGSATPATLDWQVARQTCAVRDTGRRIVMDERNGVPYLRTVVSDTDIGDYRIGDRWVPNDEFEATFMPEFNARYGVDGIQHGPLSHGLTKQDVIHKLGGYNPKTGNYNELKRLTDLFTEEVIVYQKGMDGRVTSERMRFNQYLATTGTDARNVITDALRAYGVPEIAIDIVHNRRQSLTEGHP